MSKDIKELLEKAGITEEMVEEARSSETTFLSYTGVNDQYVNLEIVAPNFVEVLLKLGPEDQENLVLAILGLMPEAGDTEVIVDSDKKRRGARVTQVKSERSEEIQLLITH